MKKKKNTFDDYNDLLPENPFPERSGSTTTIALHRAFQAGSERTLQNVLDRLDDSFADWPPSECLFCGK